MTVKMSDRPILALCYQRGYSLIGKTTSLQFVILGPIPNISKVTFKSNFKSKFLGLEKLNWLSGTLKMFRI
jgi:hypothetical protein